MGRQYNRNRRSSRQSGGVPQQFLVVIIAFFLGYLAASFFDIQKVSHWINTQVLEHAQEKKPSVQAQAQQPQVPPKPKFEFYTLLTNDKVPNSSSQNAASATSNHSDNHTTAPASATHAAAAVVTAHPAVAKANISNPLQHSKTKVIVETKPSSALPVQALRKIYVVQVAAFKARQDAEHLKATLILKGFNSSVIPISHPTRGIWYRVLVGPYSNRVLAQKAQEALARNERLRGMVTTIS